MRIRPLIFIATLFALVGFEQPCSAQGKGEAATPKLGTGRTGTLSPDEERRAARARQRATATKTPQTGSEGRKQNDDAERSKTAGAPPRTVAVEKRRRSARKSERHEVEQRTASEPAFPPVRKRAASAQTRHRIIGEPFDAPRVRGPRVGDMVPPGIRLYPLPPPGYGPGPNEAAIFRPYRPRSYYPPFPRAHYDEDYDPDVE